jgi:hypothetical protein
MMRNSKNKISSPATIAFIIIYFIALVWVLLPFLYCVSSDADVWEKLADRGTLAVIIAVFAEFPEIIAKTSKGLRERSSLFRLLLVKSKCLKKLHIWLEKHEFQIDVLALSAWVFIMIGLGVEMRSNQRARAIQDADFSRVSKASSDAGLLAAKIGTTNAWLVASNVSAAKQIEALRAKNDEIEIRERRELAEVEFAKQPRSDRFDFGDFIIRVVQKVNLQIRFPPGDAEASDFAFRIRDDLKDAGWQVDGPRELSNSDLLAEYEWPKPFAYDSENIPLSFRAGLFGPAMVFVFPNGEGGDLIQPTIVALSNAFEISTHPPRSLMEHDPRGTNFGIWHLEIKIRGSGSVPKNTLRIIIPPMK